MPLTVNCAYPRCSLRISATKIVWRQVNGFPAPYCCVSCAIQDLQRRRENEEESQTRPFTPLAQIFPKSGLVRKPAVTHI